MLDCSVVIPLLHYADDTDRNYTCPDDPQADDADRDDTRPDDPQADHSGNHYPGSETGRRGY